MSKADAISKVGLGVYTLDDVRRYTGISPKKASRWLFGTSADEPVLTADYPEDRLVSFLNLIEVLRVAELRSPKYKVSLSAIRDGLREALAEQSEDRPLAKSNRLFVFDGQVFIAKDEKEARHYIGVSRKVKDQILLTKVAEPFLEGIEYQKKAPNYALCWEPVRRKNLTVRFEPEFRFGAPHIYPGRVLIDPLLAGIDEGLPKKEVAALHEISVDAVNAAITFRDRFGHRAA